MADCDIPDCSGDDSLAFTCNECGGNYCSVHRLPEKHYCDELRSTNQDLDEIFSTGLQNHEDKKRGFTKRSTTRRPGPDQPTADYPAPSDPPDHIESEDEKETASTTDTEETKEESDLAKERTSWTAQCHRATDTFLSLTTQLGERVMGAVRNSLGPSSHVIRHRIRNLVRLVGIGLVVIASVRLFASYPIKNQGLLQIIHQLESLIQPFPKVGWIIYLVVGLLVFRLAKYKTTSRSITASLKTVSTVILVGLLVSVLVVGFTPASVPDETPEMIGEPIRDSADFTADVVGNLTNESTGDPSPNEGTAPAEGTQVSDDSDQQAGGQGDPSSASLDRARIERLVHERVNERRENHGLTPLSFDTQLRKIARYHSDDMANRDYFSHESPDGEARGDRYDRFGYNCKVSAGGNQYATGGENIFRTEFSGFDYTNEEIADQTVESWMNSSGHRENILQDYWKNEGIGVNVTTTSESTEIYVTQNFC